MAYVINKTNGLKLTSVEDGAINSTACDLVLIGKNYASYGQTINQNLVKLLENFANTTQPAKPLIGQIWYDTLNKRLKYYSGSQFKGVPTIESSSSAPASPAKGDLWYDETVKKLFYYNGSSFKLIGPQYSEAEAESGWFPALVTAQTLGSQYVLRNYIQSYGSPEGSREQIAVSSAIPFIPSISDPDFPKIKRGITLSGADSTTGESWDGVTLPEGAVLWGTAAHALRLGDYAAADYVLYSNPTFGSTVYINSNNGLNINTDNLKFFVNTATSVSLITSNLPTLRLSVTSGGNLRDVLNVDATSGLALLPNEAGAATNIGSATKRFNIVYANNFIGNLTGNISGNLSGTATTATTAGGWTTPRNLTLTGDVSGTVAFDGTADATMTTSVTNVSNALTANRWSSIRTVTFSGGDISGNFNIDGSANVSGVVLTVNPNSIAMGTDTTGAYVASAATQGWGVTGSVNAEAGIFNVVLASTSSNIIRTLVYRDGDGNFQAGTISATSTNALYADLAEKYLPDADYEPGTVLMIGGEKEVTVCNTYSSDKVAGVVSTRPGYTLNSDLEGGVLIALKGRVPCKIKGPVAKGDILVSSNFTGHAEKRRHGQRTDPLAVIGRALQDFENTGTGIIEIMV